MSCDVRRVSCDARSAPTGYPHAVRVQALVPYLPSHLPRATPTWWCASAEPQGDRLVVDLLEERDRPPTIETRCAIAAPCSLPGAFREWLGVDDNTLARWTPNRLFAEARTFAAKRKTGDKHPARDTAESLSALDRRRLARFHAALPLLGSAHVFEFDTALWLAQHDLPTQSLHRDDMRAIARRASILAHIDVDVAARDFAVASWPALEAVLGCCAAASS